NKYLPTLGIELVMAKPKVGGEGGAAPPRPAQTAARRAGPAIPEIVFTGEAASSAPAQVLDQLLAYCEEANGSDLHLAPGHVPRVRVHGELVPIPGRTP